MFDLNKSKYKDIDKDNLYNLFITQNLAAKEISKLLNIPETCLLRILQYFNFKKTPEQIKELHIRLANEKYARRTEEKRLQKSNTLKKWWANKTLEQRNNDMRGFFRVNKNRSPEHRAKLAASYKKFIANETPEEKEERIRKVSEGTKRAMAKIPIEKKKEIVRKTIETQKRNGTYRTSMPEFIIYYLLNIKFSLVERQYRTIEYPFKCDFYIPELNLYIEYQGNPGHGKEPYDPTNFKHQEKLKFWKEKAKLREIEIKRKSKYEAYIYVWTLLDPKKRKTAKENNLNWIEFFTLNQFIEWYKKQSNTPLLEYKSSKE